MTNDSLLRQWALLELIPRAPNQRHTSDLHQALVNRGYEVTIRTVQRDLLNLSRIFCLASNETGRRQAWFWMKGGSGIHLPLPDEPAALALLLAEEHLKPLLPPETLDLMKPTFAAAQRIVESTPHEGMAKWPERIQVIDRNPLQKPPALDSRVQHTVYTALFQNQKLKLNYQPRYKKKPSEYTISPLGIVSHRGLLYLVVVGDYDPFQLALHRITAAELLDEKGESPTDFTLGGYVNDDQAFTNRRFGEPIKLVIRMQEYAAKHLAECQLSTDQTIEPDTSGKEGWKRITATVNENEELHWWLNSYGAGVEVIEPSALRKAMCETAAALRKHYEPS